MMDGSNRQQRAASLPPPTISIHLLDEFDHAHAHAQAHITKSTPNFSTQTSSHEDEDIKYSVDWRPSQPPTISSRITTPDIVAPDRRHPDGSNTKNTQLLQAAIPQFLSSHNSVHATPIIPERSVKLAGYPVIGSLHNEFLKDQALRDQPIFDRQLSTKPANGDFVSTDKGKRPLSTSNFIVPSSKTEATTTPRRVRAHSASTAAEGLRVPRQISPISPPPRVLLKRCESTRNAAPLFPDLQASAFLSRGREDAYTSSHLKYRRYSADLDEQPSSQFSAQLRQDYDSQTGSSAILPSDASSEVFSDLTSSVEDPIAYENARRFPPRLPAGSVHPSLQPHDKASAVRNITSWISRHELGQKQHSPKTTRSVSVNRAGLAVPAGRAAISSPTVSPEEIEGIWQALKQKRDKLIDLRMKMANVRKELGQSRRKKDGADNAFMSMVRPLLVNLFNQQDLLHVSVGLFERRWMDMQRLGDEYHFLESNYEDLEAVVDEEEEALYSLETRFFSLLASDHAWTSPLVAKTAEREKSTSIISDTPEILLGISRDGPQEDLHPLYVELTSAVGDLENAKEDYHDLCWLKDHYEEELHLKQRTGQKIPSELLEFLEEFPTEESAIRTSMNELQEEVKRLRQLCEEKKVMRKHMSARMAHLLDPSTEFEDLELDNKEVILGKPQTLTHYRFPELLSQPDHVLARPLPLTALGALKRALQMSDADPQKPAKQRLASKEYSITRLLQDTIGGEGKGGFVNRWLLHQLRLSPINLVLLQTIFLSSCLLRIKDPWRWQCDVLHFWWSDGTTGQSTVTTGTSPYSQYSSQQNIYR
ncbi:hypothetical protein HJFPF1_07816 [Paramyrothecium foliicola]|nr:hypothetical protein HJFPF1_07816 [Paramyrothecium foliicola]